jgi:hypothetical protein
MIDQIKELIKALRPVKTKFDLIRIGGNNDGGYLIPNDLEGIVACLSPGVDVTASFEIDLCKRGIGSHLADASVDGAPEGFTPLSFTKKFIDAYNDDDTMDLTNWAIKVRALQSGGDLLLQMDIEGGEYIAIIATPRAILEDFRIICIEIHDVHHWFNNPIAWGVAQTFFTKLLKDFHVVHNHPNNNCQFIQIEDVLMPTVFELTLLRKDRAEPEGYCDQFPHPLDQPNVLNKPDRPLPEGWYK